MLAEVPEEMKCCEGQGEHREHLITYLRRNREQLLRARQAMAGKLRF